MSLFDFLKDDEDDKSQNYTNEPQPAPSDTVSPSVKDYISQKYNLAGPPVEAASTSAQYNRLANDDSAISQAKDDAEADKQRAGLFQGLSTIFAGRNKTDSGFYDNLRKDADSKVANAQKDKQGKLTDFLTANKLDTDAQNAQYKAADEAEKARQSKIAAEGDDATSDSSKSLRDFISKATPTLANTPGFENATYNQLAKTYGPIMSAYEAAEARKEAARQRSMDAGERRQERDDAHADKLDKDQRMELASAQTKLNSDTKGLRDQLDTANHLNEEIKLAQTNPEAKNILPISLARAAVGGGRINQQEINSLGGSKAIMDKAAQIAQEWSEGTLTPANYQYMLQLGELSKKSTQAALADRQRLHAQQYATRTGKSLDEAYGALTGGDSLPAEDSKPDAQPQGGGTNEVKRNTKDGRTAIFDANTKQFLRYED